MIYEPWDLGEETLNGTFPNFSIPSVGKVLQALILLNGQLTHSLIQAGDNVADRYRPVLYRIVLPIGSSKEFEKLTGYKLTTPDDISGS